MEIIPDNEQPVKTCTKCGVEYPATTEYFYFRKEQGRLRADCRTCCQKKQRRYYQENTEKVCEGQRRYYQQNADAQRAYRRHHYAANPDQMRRWRAANPDRAKEINRRWHRANPDKVKSKHHCRRARKLSLPDNFTPDDWSAALDHFDGCCAVCGRPPGLWHHLSLDHWIPLSSPDCPGTTPDNAVPLCHGIDGCNNSKKDRDAGEWLVWKFGKRKGRAILKRIEDWLETHA